MSGLKKLVKKTGKKLGLNPKKPEVAPAPLMPDEEAIGVAKRRSQAARTGRSSTIMSASY